MPRITGALLAYFEQGWEGFVAYALQPDAADRPIFLQTGQYLTIFAADGAQVWSSTLHFVRRRWWDQHHLRVGIWADSKQKGVSYAQWMDWFWRQPPMRAELEFEDQLASERPATKLCSARRC